MLLSQLVRSACHVSAADIAQADTWRCTQSSKHSIFLMSEPDSKSEPGIAKHDTLSEEVCGEREVGREDGEEMEKIGEGAELWAL